MSENVKVLIVLSEKTDKNLREFLHDPAKGYIARGTLSSFVEEAIKEKLAKSKGVSLDDLLQGENVNG